jgi:hypothetical protein
MVSNVLFTTAVSSPPRELAEFLIANLRISPGPYASAILRLQIRFPSIYPDLPPLVTFSTDIFHPLLVPLTTYTFTTGSADTDPVSATDDERLPPGGFSLRHGFPHWFGRAKRSASNSAASSRNVSGSSSGAAGTVTMTSGADTGDDGDGKAQEELSTSRASSVDYTGTIGSSSSLSPAFRMSTTPSHDLAAGSSTPGAAAVRMSPVPSNIPIPDVRKDVPAVTLLNYIRSTFDDESVLDSLPLEAAGNPGAWHAWRSHRGSARNDSNQSRLEGGGVADGQSALGPDTATLRKGSPQTRLPGEWNWEGVWVKRARSGIEASQSDSMLFGNTPRVGAGDGIVSGRNRFIHLICPPRKARFWVSVGVAFWR